MDNLFCRFAQERLPRSLEELVEFWVVVGDFQHPDGLALVRPGDDFRRALALGGAALLADWRVDVAVRAARAGKHGGHGRPMDGCGLAIAADGAEDSGILLLIEDIAPWRLEAWRKADEDIA